MPDIKEIKQALQEIDLTFPDDLLKGSVVHGVPTNMPSPMRTHTLALLWIIEAIERLEEGR